MIQAQNLGKDFFVPKSMPGILGGIKGLFTRQGNIVRAVKDISFSIAPGEFVGYIGPNGAGKSTTIKMLSGILHPSCGHVRVAGFSPHTQRVKVAASIGVVFGQRTQLWWDLPVRDSLELLAAMYRIPKVQYQRTLAEFGPVFEIEPLLEVPARKLSLGQRMRADLMAALLHRPPVLFLDEPTIGLDVVVKKRIRRCLEQVNQAGVTILLTTHDLDDIQQLCQRVIVINHGQMVFDGGLEDLNSRTGAATTVRVEYESQVSLGPLPGAKVIPINGSSVEVSFQRKTTPAGKIIATLTTWGQVRDIHIKEPEIEDVIMSIYKLDA